MLGGTSNRLQAGEHRNGGAAAMWRLLFFSFFLSDGKLAAMGYGVLSV